MAITSREEQTVTVLPDGQLQVLTVTIYEEDGVDVARKNHRKVIYPGEDVSNEAEIVKDVAQGVHTPHRKAAFAAKLAVAEEKGRD